jgi:hypothetical protein
MINKVFLPILPMRYKPTKVKIKFVPPIAIELASDSFAPNPILLRICGA